MAAVKRWPIRGAEVRDWEHHTSRAQKVTVVLLTQERNVDIHQSDRSPSVLHMPNCYSSQPPTNPHQDLHRQHHLAAITKLQNLLATEPLKTFNPAR